MFAESADITPDTRGSPIRELADRLAEEAAKAAEYRVRLEITEQAQSTLEAELETERVSRERAEHERDELAAKLNALQEPQEPPETTSEASGSDDVPLEREEDTERRSWWRRWFGG